MSALTDFPEVFGPTPCGAVRMGGGEVNAVCITLNRSVRIRLMELGSGVAARTRPYHCAIQLDALAATSQGATHAEKQLRVFRAKLAPLQGAVVVAVCGHSTQGVSVNKVLSMVRAALESLTMDYVELTLVLPAEVERKRQELSGGAWVFPTASPAKPAKAASLLMDSAVQAPPLPTLPYAEWAASPR